MCPEFQARHCTRAWQTSLFLPILGGLVLSFAYPRFDFWFLAWVALLPLLIFLDSIPNRWLALLGSFLFSVTFFSISVHWIRFVTPFGWVFVVCFYSLFPALMGFGVWHILRRQTCKVCFSDNLTLLLILPSLWVLAEWIRSEIPVMGFGWNLLSYSQTENANLLQTAKLIGAYGISFLLVLANTFIFLLWRLLSAQGSPIRRFSILAVASLITLVLFAGTTRYGFAQLGRNPEGPEFRVALVQGNIPQEEKWDPQYRKVILKKYIQLTELANSEAPDLIVWPEASFPGYYNLDREGELAQAVEKWDVPLLMGALTAESETLFYNSAYLISAKGEVLDRYDKTHLVPFGEYMPFPKILFFLERIARDMGVSDFSSGGEGKVLQISHERLPDPVCLGPLICFENIFQNLVRERVWKGAQVLCVITNDAWFKNSSAPYQHLQASVFRAVETGRWMIHSANTGISAFVSPKGEVKDRIRDGRGRDTFVMGGVTRPIFLTAENTFYLRAGYLFPYFALWVTLQSFLVKKRKR